MSVARALPACLLLLAATACNCGGQERLVARCHDDQQCVNDHGGNPNWACDADLGTCVCTADEACVVGQEHCELRPSGDGRCHPNRTCETNEDCERGMFCDTTARFCRPEGCEMDLQCPFGEVCETIRNRCVVGCRSHGDCELGQACLCLDAQGSETPCTCDEGGAEREGCPIGACAAGTCVDKTFCTWGDLCEAPAGSDERPVCAHDVRGPYCQNCISQPGSTSCGSEGPNFCLIDTSDPAGRQSFCGVDCSLAQECPNGFSCHDVLILTQSVCRGDTQCIPTGDACRAEADCPAGARCVLPPGTCSSGTGSCVDDSDCPGGTCERTPEQQVGRCGGRCAVGEGDLSGFCTCVTDSDCPQQSCGSDGRCSISRQRCVPGENDTCRGSGRIVCVNNGELGYCMIGRNCAPDEGITCGDVRCAQNPEGCQ